MRLVRRRPLEVYIFTLCAAHLVLLLLLVALLPSDALPPSHLLGSERPQPFAGLLALAALVAFAATDALLIYWLQRRNKPLKPLQAWAVWWAFVVTITALVDSLLIRSYGLLISTAFAGPMLLAALYGHRAWADDAYRFVESWQQIEAAWRGGDAALAHAAPLDTAAVVVEAPPAGGVGSSATDPSSSDVPDGAPAPPERQSSAGRRALARARDSRGKGGGSNLAASLTGPSTVPAEHGAGGAPVSPSPPPSPSSPDGQNASGQTSQASPLANTGFSTVECLACLGKVRQKAQRTAQRVRASAVLQRLLCSAVLLLMHVGLGASLASVLGANGLAVPMGSIFLVVGSAALLSIYHQPARRKFPLACVALLLVVHIIFCLLLEWPDVVRAVYAVGAPAAVTLAALMLVWYDHGWRLTKPIKIGWAAFGALLLAFIITLATLYSWQLAVGLLLAALMVSVYAAAGIAWSSNGGYLPRKWYVWLGVLGVLQAIAGALVALVNPDDDTLAAVNGFLGGSFTWWTLLVGAFAVALASNQPERGESYRYYHFPTAVPSFRFMGRGEPLQRADGTIVLYSVTALGAMAWSAVAAVMFKPMGLGVGVGVITQLLWARFLIRCAVAPLRETGTLAPFITPRVLRAAASAVSYSEHEQDSGDGASGWAGELTELLEADALAGRGVAEAIEARDKAERKLGVFKGSSFRLPGRTSAPDLEAAPPEAAADAADADAGGSCCGVTPEMLERRRAAGDLGRLDDAVRDAVASRLEVWAKFHSAVVIAAGDARAERERKLQQYLRGVLLERQRSAEANALSPIGLVPLSEDAIDAMLTIGRIRSLSAAQHAALAQAVEAVKEEQAEARRRQELQEAKEAAILEAQGKMRKLAARRPGGRRKAALTSEIATLERARQEVLKELRRAQAAAEAVGVELLALQALGVEPADHADREAAVAYVTGGAKAELEQVTTRTAELAETTDSVDTAEVIAEVSQARAAIPSAPIPSAATLSAAIPSAAIPSAPIASASTPSAASPSAAIHCAAIASASSSDSKCRGTPLTARRRCLCRRWTNGRRRSGWERAWPTCDPRCERWWRCVRRSTRCCRRVSCTDVSGGGCRIATKRRSVRCLTARRGWRVSWRRCGRRCRSSARCLRVRGSV